jgi:hypothetical protein
MERGTLPKEKKSTDARARRPGAFAPAARLAAQLLIVFLCCSRAGSSKAPARVAKCKLGLLDFGFAAGVSNLLE